MPRLASCTQEFGTQLWRHERSVVTKRILRSINLIIIMSFNSDASERSICSAHSAPFQNAAL